MASGEMTTLTFDTHAFIKRLTAAGGLATKGDIREETAPIKAELLLMKWMLGFVLAFQIAIFVKVVVH